QQCHIGSLRKANEDLQLWSRWQRERQILLRTVNAAQHSRGSRSAHRTTERWVQARSESLRFTADRGGSKGHTPLQACDWSRGLI
ncbi:G-protein coupled receptor 42, partial [Dissostichus eleginoides]